MLSDSSHARETALRPTRLGLVVVYLIFFAVVFRTLAIEENRPLLGRYLVFELVYLILYTVAFFAADVPGWIKHLYFVL
ncbi:MAG TPA: hypothetical protein VFO91_17950, partial [Anaerolineales bacterium]|nr:hypothetical protein [Anaerolineales bacterium]